ncbi:MAG TPA: ERAP1-like C-terminal domain-containing protein, partial [Pedococcus sp.]|nr:ERAP1-like C-terminal domain-containing protein [Pedococcus sp.]
ALAEAAAPGSDAQLQLVTAYAAMLTSPEDAAHVRALLEGAEVLEGLAIDTEMRWTLLTSMAAAGTASEAEIRAERERDNTSTGREREARALAARPTAEAKAAAWTSGVESDGLPNSVLDAVSLGFGRALDVSVLEPYVEKYHTMLLDTWQKRTHAIAEVIVSQFYPAALASQDLLDESQAWLDAHRDAPAALVRLVSENRDTIARALRAQARDAQG